MNTDQGKPANSENVKSRSQDKNVDYIHFETIGSTNTWAKLNAHSFNPDKITCITTNVQTAGRGRFKRVWVSPKGKNILVTFFFTLPKNSPLLPHVGQVLGLSCATMLEHQGFFPEIKWPNDILLEGKKVAGILAEAATLDRSIGIVVGIGVNVNMEKTLVEAIDQPATSLAVISGKAFSVEDLNTLLVHQFIADLATLKSKGFAPFHEHYNKLLAHKGKKITCQAGKTSVTGICLAVDLEGRLELQLPSGRVEKVSSGELI